MSTLFLNDFMICPHFMTMNESGVNISAALSGRIDDLSAVIDNQGQFPVIYVLFNDKGDAVYVGQSKHGINRIRQHTKEQKKEFEFFAMISVQAGVDLDFLESTFIDKYKIAGANLINQTKGNKAHLSNVRALSLKGFCDKTFTILKMVSALAVVHFEIPQICYETENEQPETTCESLEETISQTIPFVSDANAEDSIFQFVVGDKVKMTGRMNTDGSFTVFAKSFGVAEVNSSFYTGNGMEKTRNVRDLLIATGVMELNSNNKMEFTTDYTFENAHRATTVCIAATRNTRTSLRQVSTGKTLAEVHPK